MKKLITLLMIAFAFQNVNAQSPAWQWAKTAGGASSDNANSICVDAAGNSYVTGSYSSATISFGSTTFTNSGGIDMFTVKYDATGNVIWAVSAKGISNEVGYNITTDASGNVYVVGTFNSSTMVLGTTTLTLVGNDDIFVVKYDASGNVLWAKRAGGSGNDIGQNIAVDASGNACITGYFASISIAFGTTTLTAAGGNDFYVAKYDASGNSLWAKSAGGSGNDAGSGIATDASGNSYITGSFSSPTIGFGSTTLTNTGGLDVFTVKYDASGNALWAKSATGSSNEVGYNIALDTGGDPYVIGTYNSSTATFSTTALTLSAFDDIFIVKYDPSGNLFWAKSVGGTGNDIGAGIAVDGSGNAYITGYFASTSMAVGATTLTNAGTNDVYIAKYNSSGSAVWAIAAGGTGDDRSSCIAADASGNSSYIAGYFASSSMSVGSTTLTSAGGNDVLVAKYGTTTGIAEEAGQAAAISVFPNPNNGAFTLQIKDMLSSAAGAQVTVTNALGQLIYETKQHSQTMDLKIEQAGIYFVSVTNGSQRIIRKVMVN